MAVIFILTRYFFPGATENVAVGAIDCPFLVCITDFAPVFTYEFPLDICNVIVDFIREAPARDALTCARAFPLDWRVKLAIIRILLVLYGIIALSDGSSIYVSPGKKPYSRSSSWKSQPLSCPDAVAKVFAVVDTIIIKASVSTKIIFFFLVFMKTCNEIRLLRGYALPPTYQTCPEVTSTFSFRPVVSSTR